MLDIPGFGGGNMLLEHLQIFVESSIAVVTEGIKSTSEIGDCCPIPVMWRTA
jgi:hypothetical protein